MWIKYTPIVILLASTAWGQTPIGMQKWRVDDTTFTQQFGGAPHNYPNAAGWHPIENNFQINGEGVFMAQNALLKTSVDSLGNVIVNYIHNETDYTVVQQLHSLKFFRKSDSVWINIDNTPNWNNISQDSNIIKWTGVFPAVDYRIRKDRGQVENGIFYKPLFLDSAVVLYNQRSDSLNIYLANVMKFTLSASIDGHDMPLGNIRKRVLKRFGGLVFQIGRQPLNYPDSDILPEVPVWQRHIFVGNQLYVLEFVKMSEIKRIHELHPAATLWHSDDLRLDNDTDIDDAFIHSWEADKNFGATSNNFLYKDGGTEGWFVIKAKNVNDSLGAGATISFAACSIYVTVHDISDPTVSAYGMFNPTWVEGDENGVDNDDGDITWNDWQSDALEWITDGIECDDDGGTWNTTDNGACNPASGRDRKATAEDSYQFTGTGWFGLEFSTWAQTCYDADTSMSLVLQVDAADGGEYINAREATSDPFFTFTYTVGAADAYEGQAIIIGGQ